MSSTQLPLEYLATSSANCLEGFELARRNEISNLRKEFLQVFDELVEAEIAARIARWILEGRRTQGDEVAAERLAPAHTSSRELLAKSPEAQQLLLARTDPGPRRRCDAKKLSSGARRTGHAPKLVAESSRKTRGLPESESALGAQCIWISANARSALQLLEQSHACQAQRIGYCGGRSSSVHRKFANRTLMLSFPTGKSSEASANAALQEIPAMARAHARGKTTTAVHRKVLSLPLPRPATPTGSCLILEGASRKASHNDLSYRDVLDVVRPFPPVRTPAQKPLVFGNVALSHF